MRARLALAGVVTALSVAACGSTVQLQGATTAGGDGLGTPGASGAAGSDTAASTAGGAGGTGVSGAPAGGGTGGAAAGSSTPGPASAATSGATGAHAAGATSNKPVEIGIVIYPDVNAAAKSLGGSANVGDQKAEADTAIAWVNAHGGLNGHKLVPVYFSVSLTSTQPYSQTYQEICATFTQDHHVAATIFIGNAENGLPACITKGHSLLLTHGHYLRTLQEYASYPTMYAPEEVSSDRVAQALVNQIVGRGILKSGDKLGVLVMDYAGPNRALNAIVTPQLKAKGIEVVSYSVPYPKSTPDIGNSVSAVQSAELAMASRGVKAVTFFCPGCFNFFMQDAESQAYYPRYVLTSYDDLLSTVAGKNHGRSLGNAVALSWSPVQDVSTFSHPDVEAGNATYALCRKVEQKNIADDASLYASLALCGAVQDLYAAARASGTGAVTDATLAAGLGRLGSTHAGAANFATALSGQRHDGAAAFTTMHYDSGCDCLAYDAAKPIAF